MNENKIMKVSSTFKDLDTLLSRKDTLVKTVKNAILRENKTNLYQLKYKYTQIILTEDNFVLQVVLDKQLN